MTVEPTTPAVESFGLVHGQETLIAKLRNMSPELLAILMTQAPGIGETK